VDGKSWSNLCNYRASITTSPPKAFIKQTPVVGKNYANLTVAATNGGTQIGIHKLKIVQIHVAVPPASITAAYSDPPSTKEVKQETEV